MPIMKTMRRLIRKFLRRRPTWEDLTPRERRVAIAQDVIDQIHAGGLPVVRAGAGYVVRLRHDLGAYDQPLEAPCSVDSARELQRNCQVCACGALLLSKIAKFNGVANGDIIRGCSDDITFRHLADAFSEEELGSIEEAFELWGNNDAARFGERYPHPLPRLLAICENIVENGGFKPPRYREA